VFRFTSDQGSCCSFSGVIFDPVGNLYGSTYAGGDGVGDVFQLTFSAGNSGTVYELTPSTHTFNVLHSFVGSEDEGPFDAVVLDAQGNLYGTTYGGGSHHAGNVFKLTYTPGGWVYQWLYDFTGGADGRTPESKLMVDANGNLYGTTSFGGTGCGSAGWRRGV
jgi:uncharacterized repeat protein (TIGR03803 family)